MKYHFRYDEYIIYKYHNKYEISFIIVYETSQNSLL